MLDKLKKELERLDNNIRVLNNKLQAVEIDRAGIIDTLNQCIGAKQITMKFLKEVESENDEQDDNVISMINGKQTNSN